MNSLAKKVVVAGYGSIGKRHVDVLEALSCSVAVVSSQKLSRDNVFTGLGEALKKHLPDYVVIASATTSHLSALELLADADFHGAVLVEKPLFAEPAAVPANSFALFGVGYNLRFHPVLRELRRRLRTEKVLSVHAYVGQYLPEWRTGRSYRESYSAAKDEGGGALRDLSHELDYLCWLFGGWKRVTGTGGHLSSLEISSDDAFGVLLETEHCPLITLQLNYLDRCARREIIVNSDSHTFRADLIRGALAVDGSEQILQFARNDSYRAEHLQMLSGSLGDVCSASDAGRVVELVAHIEQASREHIWKENRA